MTKTSFTTRFWLLTVFQVAEGFWKYGNTENKVGAVRAGLLFFHHQIKLVAINTCDKTCTISFQFQQSRLSEQFPDIDMKLARQCFWK